MCAMNVSSNPGLDCHPHNSLHPMVGNTNMSAHKTSVTMDSQYMQQQSQIFVFSTSMANDAAEAVDSGQFASVIEFHSSNPETKKLLDKYPLKSQPNRTTSSAVWLNHLAQRQGGRGIKGNINAQAMHPSAMKNSFGQPRGPVPCVGSCNTHNPSGLPSGPGPGGGVPNNWPNNPNMCSNANPNPGPNWSSPQPQQQPMFAQNSEMNSNQKFSNSPIGANGPNVRPCAPFPANHFQNNPQMFNNSCNTGLGVPQLAEIPDENLTPQQRQHREKQLAILRKMQQQLCPEMMEMSPMGPMMRMPAPNHLMNAPDYMIDPNMCSLPDTDHMSNTDPQMTRVMTPSSMMSTQNNNTTHYSQSNPSMPPTSGTGGLEWPKANFMEDRRRKSQIGGQGVHNSLCNNSVPISHPSPHSQPSSAINSPNPCISQSPGSRIPPPPYDSGIRSHPSPHPSSPAASSLPLPSPRVQSPLAADCKPDPSKLEPLKPDPSKPDSKPDPSKPDSKPDRSTPDLSRQQLTPGGQSRLPHTSPGPATPSADSNSSITGTGVHSPKQSIPSATSSTVVQNNSRIQTSTNVTNIRATTPSTSTPLGPNSSPSNVKKLPNLMIQNPKGMGQDCSDLLMNSLPNSGPEINRKLHQNDMTLMAPTVGTHCSSPFLCKQEPALMPVPSPQQIQYLSAFEGQELTIQKQPNTSLRDTDLISPVPDLDLGFSNQFGNNCHPFPTSERLPNFAIMDNMNPRFASNPNNPNMSGQQFEMNPRFMSPDNNNQRFVGPVFDGPTPRMPNSHESQFRPQTMLCMPYGQMDNHMMRFSSPCDNVMAPRGRGPSDMAQRFPQHPNDAIHSPQHFNSSMMSPINGEQMNLMPFGPNQSSGARCMGAINNFNPQMESGVSSTHLQNLQKMTPPFDIGPPKGDQMMVSNGAHGLSHNTPNQVMHGSNGPMVSQSQRTNTFDPISSMAAMGESNANSVMNAPNIMSGPSMNMTAMQVSANGPPPGPTNMVNFHTSMSSMQGIHQNMSAEGNGMNGGMQGQYAMNQMNPNMSGGPQTVNNTYVNATMSIQQLNIQNLPTPNFDQNMNVGPQSMPPNGPGMSPPSGAMQMMQTNSSAKGGNNFGHRMSGPTTGPNFTAQQMNNTRGMNPMAYPPNPHMMQRCSTFNSANIQIKPDAPNTIQYLPPRQQNPNLSARAPSLDFLQRCEPPLTNLGNKLPTHNLQYFPSNNANVNSNQSMPLGPRMMGQNMSIGSGPGRPTNPSMIRGPNPSTGMVSGQQMMSSSDMFGRPSGPNNMMNGPHMMSNPPNPMFTNMKQSASGSMSPGLGMAPDAAQPLPPSVGHSYNYKQSPFGGPMTSDPNYAIQFQNFQQQLYATNTTRASANANNASNNPRMPSNNNFNNSFK